MAAKDSEWAVLSVTISGWPRSSFWGRKNVTLRTDAWEVIVFHEGVWRKVTPVSWDGTEWVGNG